MPRHESFAFDASDHNGCWRWCRIHWYYNFAMATQHRFPGVWSVLSSRTGWRYQKVYCGPGAWYPKKEKRDG
jgi:hypothetical protein